MFGQIPNPRETFFRAAGIETGCELIGFSGKLSITIIYAAIAESVVEPALAN
jgi:hypothetical protein